jgi:ribosomal protein S18 acetylase RimI-like enzyme
MATPVTVYYLEMTDPGQLRPARRPDAEVEVKQARVVCPELNRFLYTAVGGHWYWLDRLSWTYERWRAYLDRPELETWLATVGGTPAGYCELETQPGANIEIAYFGLLPQFLGRGVGGYLLTAAVQRAWQKKAARVWLHTCTLDHPAALANYRARGFRVFDEKVSDRELPARPPGPWPGFVGTA